MSELDQEERLIRSYLLGELDESAREQFEKRFFSDPDFREIALMVEDELTEDYVAGLLNTVERDKFVRNYLTSPHQIQKLRITKALNECVDRHPPPLPAMRPSLPRPRGFFQRWRRARRLFRLATAAVVLVALVAGVVAVLLVKRYSGRATLFRQLHELNDRRVLPEIDPSQRLAIVLSPRRVRGDASKEVPVPSDVSVISLVLTGVPEGYQDFVAQTAAVGGEEVFTLKGLAVESAVGTRQIVINVPPDLLGPGDYLVSLRGLTTAGQYEEVAEYFFRILPL